MRTPFGGYAIDVDCSHATHDAAHRSIDRRCAFHCGADRATPLATLLLQKTEGNPFFLGQLLVSLVNDGTIEFDADAGSYHWDIEGIRSFGLTRDIVELMVGKIQKLTRWSQRAHCNWPHALAIVST